jgi:hypothetical protein
MTAEISGHFYTNTLMVSWWFRLILSNLDYLFFLTLKYNQIRLRDFINS